MCPKIKYIFLFFLSLISSRASVQLMDSENPSGNNIHGNTLNECLSIEGRSKDLGVCFGGEVLNQLSRYDEEDTFSLASGVTFTRDEKTPRDFGNFLEKDPLDFRAMVEGASNLISRRSLHWDMSRVYPGLAMRIGPTLANGLLEFVMDPRIKDREYSSHEELGTGRLLAKQLLVPFLLGLKFQLSTLLPLLLGLLLLASKKAFILAKLAILAVTVFGSGLGSANNYPSPGITAYDAHYTEPEHFHNPHSDVATNKPHWNFHESCNCENPGFSPGSGHYSYPRPHHQEYSPYFKEKSSNPQPTPATPITPEELRDRLERLFTAKNEMNQPREGHGIVRDTRNFKWSPSSENFKTHNLERH